ncbi:GNAT family N-acetyltransferase [Smaragdicoccus niigatensis]
MSDVPAIVELIHDLASYERLASECTVTPAQMETALFGKSPKVFAQVATEAGEVVGIAVWFLSFSTWDGVHGLYLEDLYVRPENRGAGHGLRLLAALAKECVENGYTRLGWSVLDWNAPSIAFYESIGAAAQSEWTGYRLSGPALTALAGL